MSEQPKKIGTMESNIAKAQKLRAEEKENNEKKEKKGHMEKKAFKWII